MSMAAGANCMSMAAGANGMSMTVGAINSVFVMIIMTKSLTIITNKI